MSRYGKSWTTKNNSTVAYKMDLATGPHLNDEEINVIKRPMFDPYKRARF